MTPSGTHPSGSKPAGTDPFEQSPSLARELSDSELRALEDTQEAEALLFEYVVTSAGKLETPLVILKKLANNLGDPQRLPATKILQTAVEHPLDHPLSTLIAMEGILENTFEDSAAKFEEELASSLHSQHSTPWISLGTGDGAKGVDDNDVMPHSPFATPSLQAKPLVERKKHKIFPVGKIFFIGLAMIYGFMVLKTGEISPFGIVESIKTQRAAHIQTEQAEPLSNSDAVQQNESLQDTQSIQNNQSDLDGLSPRENESAQNGGTWEENEAHKKSESKDTSNGAGGGIGKDEGKAEETPPFKDNRLQVPSPRPLGETGSLRQRPHPGVVSLPGEIPEASDSVNSVK